MWKLLLLLAFGCHKQTAAPEPHADEGVQVSRPDSVESAHAAPDWPLPATLPVLEWGGGYDDVSTTIEYSVHNPGPETIWLLDVGAVSVGAEPTRRADWAHVRYADTPHHAVIFHGADEWDEIKYTSPPDLLARPVAPGETVQGTAYTTLPFRMSWVNDKRAPFLSGIDGVELEIAWLSDAAFSGARAPGDPARVYFSTARKAQRFLKAAPQPWSPVPPLAPPPPPVRRSPELTWELVPWLARIAFLGWQLLRS